MKIAASRPYGEAFVSSIASSSEPISTTGATGPNVSSVATSESARHAVEDRRLPVEVGREAVGARAAGDERGTALERVGDVLVHLRRAPARCSAGRSSWSSANGSPSSTRSATSAASRSTNSSRTSRCTSRRSPAVQLWPAQRKQAVTVASAARVEVGVVEHDERAVAAQLEHARLAGGRLGDLRPGLGRADEADAVRAGVAGDLVADDRARAGDQVEHARRQVGLGDALGERDRGDGGRRRRRPDDGVAARERRRDQLGRHRVRPVPRRDHADDAARPADEQHALPGETEFGIRPSSRLPSSAALRQ